MHVHNNGIIRGMRVSLVHLFPLINSDMVDICSFSLAVCIVRAHRYIQSQPDWNVVRQASQLGNEGHLFNVLDLNREEEQNFRLPNGEEIAFKSGIVKFFLPT